jgi:hypothetical protein
MAFRLRSMGAANGNCAMTYLNDPFCFLTLDPCPCTKFV